jgi:hypothetical protein
MILYFIGFICKKTVFVLVATTTTKINQKAVVSCDVLL